MVSSQARSLDADGPQFAKKALENAPPTLMSQVAEAQASQNESAGRIGIRQGKVSELTVIAPFAPGGAQRLRAVLRFLNGNFSAGTKVGTLHNMRFVFLDNDTKFLFATAYDGQWDPYIEDFATKIPDEMDIIFSAFEGWPGIHSPKVKDWIAEHQIPQKAGMSPTRIYRWRRSVGSRIPARRLMSSSTRSGNSHNGRR